MEHSSNAGAHSTPFQQAKLQRLPRKIITLLAELKGASSCRDLAKGRRLHEEAVENGAEYHKFVASSLVDMYSKCGCMETAHEIFDKMVEHDVVSWTTLILGYAQNGNGEIALELFQKMEASGCVANGQTFVAALKACTSLGAHEEAKRLGGSNVKMGPLEKGMYLHSRAAKSGFMSDIFVAAALADMYWKCGAVENARDVFDRTHKKSTVLWNTLILGYVHNGEGMMALRLFSHMLTANDCLPVRTTYLAVLKGCAVLAEEEVGQNLNGNLVKVTALEIGMLVHLEASKSRLETELRVASALVDMYCKCGSLKDARAVFERMETRDTVSWNSLILGYAQNGDGRTALELFQTMLSEGYVPTRSSFLASLEACIALTEEEECQSLDGRIVKVVSLETSMIIHSRANFEAQRQGCELDIMVANMLIDVYAKCGSTNVDARRVFDGMTSHSLVSWTVLMSGYAQNNDAKMVLEIFSGLRCSNPAWTPTSQVFVAALQASADLPAFEVGKAIHGDVCRAGMETETHIQTSLVDFYGKCGNTLNSQIVFDTVWWRGIEIWSAVIAGYSRQGNWERVLDLFDRMIDTGVCPNAVTFLSLQIACSRAGLIDKAKAIFQRMSSSFGVEPGLEHHHCLIDALGRANQLENAVALVEKMPYAATAVTWMTVLGSCQKWKNLEIGKRAFDAVLELDDTKQQHAAAYILMADIYKSS